MGLRRLPDRLIPYTVAGQCGYRWIATRAAKHPESERSGHADTAIHGATAVGTPLQRDLGHPQQSQAQHQRGHADLEQLCHPLDVVLTDVSFAERFGLELGHGLPHEPRRHK